MRVNLLIALSILYVFVPIKNIQAARFSGDYLLKLCAVNDKGEEVIKGGHAACQAYISGIMDYHVLIRSMGAAPSIDFCVPDQTALYTIQNNVWHYLDKNRAQHGHFIAAPGVALGLFSKYPCKP